MKETKETKILNKLCQTYSEFAVINAAYHIWEFGIRFFSEEQINQLIERAKEEKVNFRSKHHIVSPDMMINIYSVISTIIKENITMPQLFKYLIKNKMI